MKDSLSTSMRAFAATALALTLASVAQGKPPKPEERPKAPAPSVRDSLSGAARDDYDLGRILVENGDYAGAVVKFQHAYELSSDPRLLWNMGVCEKYLRHYAKLLRYLERYQREGGDQLSAEQRVEATTVVETVRSLVSALRITTNVEGATVYLDGEPVGVTPLAEDVLVDLGDHRLRVSKAGYKDQDQPLHVAGASEFVMEVVLEKEPTNARLAISARPKNSTIRLDGVPVGASQWQGNVAPGRHTLLVEAPGMRSKTTDLVIQAGQSRSIDWALDPESHSHLLWWIGGGVLAAAGVGVGSYFLLHSSQPSVGTPTSGTIGPGYIPLPNR